MKIADQAMSTMEKLRIRSATRKTAAISDAASPRPRTKSAGPLMRRLRRRGRTAARRSEGAGTRPSVQRSADQGRHREPAEHPVEAGPAEAREEREWVLAKGDQQSLDGEGHGRRADEAFSEADEDEDERQLERIDGIVRELERGMAEAQGEPRGETQDRRRSEHWEETQGRAQALG